MARQQTLEASVAWSHDLLDEHERVVLRRFSVFSGGFTLDAAEAVAADELIDRYEVLDLLSRLVDKSLVQLDEDEHRDTRFRLLETIRQYARERLVESGETDVVRDRHLAHCPRARERAEPELCRPGGPIFSRSSKPITTTSAPLSNGPIRQAITSGSCAWSPR